MASEAVATRGRASVQSTAVIVDHDPLIALGAEQVARRLGVSVLGKATTVRNGLELVRRHRPKLLIVDAERDDVHADGLVLIREARECVSELKIVALGRSSDPDWIQRAFNSGADAYVLKSAHPDDLASAIRQAFDHSVYFPVYPEPRETSRLPPVQNGASKLTARELEVLQLVAEGASNSRIAKALWVTEQTVKFHLTNVYRKLGVTNRTEASRWADLQGLLERPSVPEANLRAVGA